MDILRVCVTFSYLFIHNDHIIISFRCSHIGLGEHIQTPPPQWTLHLFKPERNLALWQEFVAVWELWVMTSAPAFAFINCWSPRNNWLGILVNTSSENVCGGACLHRPRRTSVHFSNPLNNLALVCVTGSLSRWGPLPQSKVWGSLGLSCVGRFCWNTWRVILQNLPAGDISPLFFWKSMGGAEPQDSCV